MQSGDNIINVLRAAFTLIDPKCVKKIDKLTVILMHLGSAIVKAACRTLMKLSPDVADKVPLQSNTQICVHFNHS